MPRTPALIATGLCAAPLLVLAGFGIAQLVGRGGGGGSDQTIATGYLGLFLGMVLAVAGFVAAWYLGRAVADRHLPYLLGADAIALVAGVITWYRIAAPDPPLEYANQQPVLEVEARIPKAALAGRPVTDVASVDFAGGTDQSVPHPEGVRDDGAFMVLPWETTPFRVRAWEVRVFLHEREHDRESLFRLDLPRRPQRSTDWSGWVAPVTGEGSETPAGLAIRYRFRLIPYGSP